MHAHHASSVSTLVYKKRVQFWCRFLVSQKSSQFSGKQKLSRFWVPQKINFVVMNIESIFSVTKIESIFVKLVFQFWKY